MNKVSVEEILKAMDEFEVRYFKSIDDILVDVNEKYEYLKSSGSLTSENLDSVYTSIKQRLQKMKDDFTMTKDKIKTNVNESASDISSSETNIEQTLM